MLFRLLSAAVWALLILMIGSSSPLLASEESGPIAACFEGPATEIAEKNTSDDDLSRSMAEMKAGAICAPIAEETIHTCLTEIDQAEDDIKDYYGCIGLVANPCIDSAWATNEFRSVVCIGTEEKVWLDIVHDSLDQLKTRLGTELGARVEAMEKKFFAYRDEQCGLMRALREGSEPDIAYGACTTETVARFAIDLWDMQQTTEEQVDENSPDHAKQKQDGDDSVRDQSTAEGEIEILGSKSAPVRADNPAGEEAYLKRLRCPDGTAPAFDRSGSFGYGGYGNIVDLYEVRCEGTGESRQIYMDMYHSGYVETQSVPGFTLSDE